MPPQRDLSRLTVSAAWISTRVPRIVTINLAVALLVWWVGWPVDWLAGVMAIATLCAALVVSLEFWLSARAWRSVEQMGLKRNRDLLFRSVRYHLIDETISERTIPLGCLTFVVMLITGFVSTASGLLALATLLLIGSWAAVLRNKELWPLVESEDPSDPR